jgi:microcystin-dependent protein
MVEVLNGSSALDGSNPLYYDSQPTLSSDEELATKKYADDLAIAGVADASTTVKGASEEATQAEIDADTAAGGQGRLFTNPSTLATSKYGTRLPSADEKAALAGNQGTPSSSNTFVTEDFIGFFTGIVVPYAGSSAPTGWLLCDGTTGLDSTSDTSLADLFTVIGTTYGGTGAADFDLPDLRGNFILGKDNMGGSSRNRVTDTEADTVGSEAGSQTHTLTTDEIPAHTHDQYAGSSGGGSDTWMQSFASGQANQVISAENTSSVGGGSAHENMPPYMTMNYIIKK